MRASEAVCACEAMLLPVGRVWNGQSSSWAGRVPFPLVLSAYGKCFLCFPWGSLGELWVASSERWDTGGSLESLSLFRFGEPLRERLMPIVHLYSRLRFLDAIFNFPIYNKGFVIFRPGFDSRVAF